ncbi:MAG: MBL fold metallo-hydrolase [Kiritimatiellae bacterium]|nr:MBL fold metallo-hydrolase [Kiritimatiellia bacterium]MDW8459163.1 MBL fold metallo-hydrolase [Verrucomicrobiota bacterium]
MRLIVGGVRGSYPVAQPAFMKYGGETTSILIEGVRGDHIFIDAGTGIRVLGRRLASAGGPRRVLLLMTHYHLDHIMGLPSLGLLYDSTWTIEIAAPALDAYQVEETMSRIMDKPFWPLQISDVRSRVRFHTLEGRASSEPLQWGTFEIRWCPVSHPGGCTAYRIDEPPCGASVVIATDIEWAAATEEEQSLLVGLCSKPEPVELLMMDAQYEPEEIDRYRGWGHSSWLDALAVARMSGARAVKLIHHDPRKDDSALDELAGRVASADSCADLARAGEEIELGRSSAA